MIELFFVLFLLSLSFSLISLFSLLVFSIIHQVRVTNLKWELLSFKREYLLVFLLKVLKVTTILYLVLSLITQSQGKDGKSILINATVNIICVYRYDYFLVSQHVRQGTVTPTHYNVVSDTSGLKADHMQK